MRPTEASHAIQAVRRSLDIATAGRDTKSLGMFYFRTTASLTALDTDAGATHSGVLKVFAVARAAPVCHASPGARNIFRAHVAPAGVQATCVVAAE